MAPERDKHHCLNEQPSSYASSVSTSYLQTIADGLRVLGLDPSPILVRLDLVDVLRNPDARVPGDKAYALWAEAVRATGDENIGLQLAGALEPGTFGVLDYAMRNAATLADAFEVSCRYSNLVHTNAAVWMRTDSQCTWLAYTLRESVSMRQAAEFFVATWLVMSRDVVRKHVVPTEVRFQHAKPRNIANHKRLFGTDNIQFLATANELAIPAQVAHQALPKSDAKLAILLNRYAAQLSLDVANPDDFLGQVRHAITHAMRTGTASRSDVADALGISERTLVRHLGHFGTTYRVIINEVRTNLAKRHLLDSTLSVAEVAFLVGFSDQSSFTRAFKRETGTTPAEFRNTGHMRTT